MADSLPPNIAAALAEGLRLLRPLAGGEVFDTAVPAAMVQAGLHLLPIPIEFAGLGGRLTDAVRVLAELGAMDGSAALGLAMHFHTLGSAVESGTWPDKLLDHVIQAVRADGALINLAATEEKGGSPARGAMPAMTAVRDGSDWIVNGEKNWTTWLPALRFAVITARLAESAMDTRDEFRDSSNVGYLLLDLSLPGVERLAAFDGLGMRASASGKLVLNAVRLKADRLIGEFSPDKPNPGKVVSLSWFCLCVAAVYLGIGEGARAELLRWAVARRPGDGSCAVGDIPSVRLRLGRLHAELRAARILLLEIARRWDRASSTDEREDLLADVYLAKLKATQAAVEATDECLRIAGGPGFLGGPLERAFRDARAGLINPPLEDVAYQEFAHSLVEHARLGSG